MALNLIPKLKPDLILLPETDLKGAVQLGNKIREQVSAKPFIFEDAGNSHNHELWSQQVFRGYPYRKNHRPSRPKALSRKKFWEKQSRIGRRMNQILNLT